MFLHIYQIKKNTGLMSLHVAKCIGIDKGYGLIEP